MSNDPDDELAQARARRQRERSAPGFSLGGDADRTPDQQAAIERAREAWLLRRAGRDAPAEDDDD